MIIVSKKNHRIEIKYHDLWCFHTRARQRQDNDKTNVEPVHSSDAFHTRHAGPGVKGIIERHRFNICLVVVLSLSCSCVKTPLLVKLDDLPRRCLPRAYSGTNRPDFYHALNAKVNR